MMHRLSTTATVVASVGVLGLVAGCGQPVPEEVQPVQTQVMSLSDEDRAAVETAFFAVANADLAMDWDTIAANMTDAHVQLDPRAPALRSRAAWRAWVEGLEIGEVNGEYAIDELGGSGNHAYVIWSYDGWWTEGGNRMEGKAKGIALYERQPDGTWLQSHLAWNMDPEQGG